MNLIVVSNRVARPTADEPIDGGLAAALLPAVQICGAIWVGAKQCCQDSAEKEAFAEIQSFGTGAIATVNMPAAHYRRYYEGFANSALWPILHSRTDLLHSNDQDYVSYREINAFMARSLLRFVESEAFIWVHDYHFLTLGSELRRFGLQHPIGFFLHTPFPLRAVFASLPHHRELVRAMLSYDLIGFQTEDDRSNFADYLETELGLRATGDGYCVGRRVVRLAAFPIGIDAEAFAVRAAKAATRPEVLRLRASLQGAKLAIGVDRVDYSKGLTNRLQAFELMLRERPLLKREVALLQIAVPSRGQIEAYCKLQHELATLVSDINGRIGEVDWMPIRYLNKGFSQAHLAGFYRSAQVGLVTSLHDGMNLVAKEYVAAQDPDNPGVLVLSKFAGAAKQLDAALLVNPHDIDGLSRAIADAFAMRHEERRERWRSMMKALESSSLVDWFSSFMAELRDIALQPDYRSEEGALLPFRNRHGETVNA
ncbi:MAG TPA: trehalose-6-phosphate synthase [Xanthobacteraceae bacterium]|nr:trehalose-6-phosphate synthase [Xanthobacteraceae bacterium]